MNFLRCVMLDFRVVCKSMLPIKQNMQKDIPLTLVHSPLYQGEKEFLVHR